MNRKGSTTFAVLFCIVLAVAVAGIIYALGQKAVKEGIIQLEDDVKPAEKLTAIEVAKNAIATHNLYRSEAWGKIDLMPGEWQDEETFLEIRYMYHEISAGASHPNSVLVYVIVHPREKIGGIYLSTKPRECMTLALGSYGDKLPAAPKGGFSSNTKILSTMGIVHSLTDVVDEFVTVEPPLTRVESESSYLYVDDPKATVESFVYEVPQK